MKKALIVGINDYPNSPLNGCVNDANAIGTILESHGDGSPNFGVKIMTSPSSSITRSTLRESIESLFSGIPIWLCCIFLVTVISKALVAIL